MIIILKIDGRPFGRKREDSRREILYLDVSDGTHLAKLNGLLPEGYSFVRFEDEFRGDYLTKDMSLVSLEALLRQFWSLCQ